MDIALLFDQIYFNELKNTFGIWLNCLQAVPNGSSNWQTIH